MISYKPIQQARRRSTIDDLFAVQHPFIERAMRFEFRNILKRLRSWRKDKKQ